MTSLRKLAAVSALAIGSLFGTGLASPAGAVEIDDNLNDNDILNCIGVIADVDCNHFDGSHGHFHGHPDGHTHHDHFTSVRRTSTASNTATISNRSNGTAVVDSGDANAVGNVSNTDVNQGAVAQGKWASARQRTTVSNTGVAYANSGGNTAVGNNSTNVVYNQQTARASS